MDPISNPYAPGAGTTPPELAGRDEWRKKADIGLRRIKAGKFSKSLILIGLRGVGKTVLLDAIRRDAEESGMETLRIEAPEHRSLPAILAPQLRIVLLRLSRMERVRSLANRALRALSGFVGALRVKYEDIEVGLDMEPEPGLADNGDLEHDLPMLLETAGQAAVQANTALVLFIDELQYVPEQQLAALITALHKVSQLSLPITMVGAGLPQIPGKLGRAKSYAERLFEFADIGPLNREDAKHALVKPARDLQVEFETEAIHFLLEKTSGYPYFIQEWGKQTWDFAPNSPITIGDARQASRAAIAALDESFFRVRFDRLTPMEKKYLRAMAELGPGPHRSGDIAEQLGKSVTKLGLVRNQLIGKGMIWSPHHGDTAFSVPLFDQFMVRIMPGDDWRST